jgi:hypothetical protein
MTRGGTRGRSRDDCLRIRRGLFDRRMSDARHCPRGPADHRTSGLQKPVDLTDPGDREQPPRLAPARQGDGWRQSRRTYGSPSDHPSVSSTAACPRHGPPIGERSRHRNGHPASTARSGARTSDRRQPSQEHRRDPTRHLLTAVNWYLRPVAGARRHCSHSRGRAPPGCDPYRTVLRHCWRGAILGRHCSSEEIPSSFCKLYGLIPAPPCAPGCREPIRGSTSRRSGLRSLACHAGIAADLGRAAPSVGPTRATRTKCCTNRKSHPSRGGSF